mgnify:CR=1 FL=1
MDSLIGDYGQERICRATGKIMLSKREAGNQLNNLKGHRTSSHIGRGTNKPKRSYFCKDCGAYHVTHYAQAQKKKTFKTYQNSFDEDELSSIGGFDISKFI